MVLRHDSIEIIVVELQFMCYKFSVMHRDACMNNVDIQWSLSSTDFCWLCLCGVWELNVLLVGT